jgi:hypothetical protein
VIPFRNGTLSSIAPVGTSADYDTPAAPGAPRWEGEEGIYVAEEIVEVLSPGKVDEVLQTRLEIPHFVGRLVHRDDLLTYTYENVTVTRTAGTITHAPLVGRVRVLLEDG